jgi:aminoglycoside/choline kinase family phosphotransferase
MTASPIVWTDTRRASAFSAWLQASGPDHGLQAETLQLASADASFRRYFRIQTAAGASRIIMDAPPDQENCAPFVKVAQLMTDAGLSAPQVLAWDQAQGFMLLSDLGNQTMLDVIEQTPEADKPQQAYPLYRSAVDALITWQLASRPGVLPPYDEALLSRELALFPDWYVAKHRGLLIDDAMRSKLDGLFAQITADNLNALSGARVYVHRDFMPRNLMVAASPSPGDGSTDHAGVSLGILDFQDAVYGPITYDIASLMRDAFLSWPEDFVLDITVRYWEQARKAGLPVGDDFGEFYRAVEWMGLQRQLKILGIFARLTLRDGKPKYLADTPRFIKYARNTCARYRQLGPLMVLLDEIEGNETRVGYTF